MVAALLQKASWLKASTTVFFFFWKKKRKLGTYFASISFCTSQNINVKVFHHLLAFRWSSSHFMTCNVGWSRAIPIKLNSWTWRPFSKGCRCTEYFWKSEQTSFKNFYLHFKSFHAWMLKLDFCSIHRTWTNFLNAEILTNSKMLRMKVFPPSRWFDSFFSSSVAEVVDVE